MYGMGFDQLQTFSFISPRYYDKIRMAADDTRRKSVVISNPLGEDTSVMRTTALPSLIEVIARNNNLSNNNVRVFEMASIYIPSEDVKNLPEERKILTLGMYGDEDFYSLKGAVVNVLEAAGIEKAKFVSEANDNAYHPGRCAKVYTADGVELGVIGQIHPLTAQNYDLDVAVYVAELDFDRIWDCSDLTVDYKPMSKFPSVTRDFSFVCDESLEVGTIEEVMTRAAGKLCVGVALFDIYRGAQIGEGKKSVSFRLTLHANDRTLTVEEADKVSSKVLNDLKFKLGIGIRE